MSGIEYEDTKRGKMVEAIVEAIMTERAGNLEWIVNHWVTDAPESCIKDWAKDAKIRYIKEEVK